MEFCDVFLVNNRRTATRWRDSGLVLGLRKPRIVRLDPGDRVVIRMSFYYPREIKADGSPIGSVAAVPALWHGEF